MNSTLRGVVAAAALVVAVASGVAVFAADGQPQATLDTVPTAQPAVLAETTYAPTTTTSTTVAPTTEAPTTLPPETTTTAAPKPRPVAAEPPPETTEAPWPALPEPQPYTITILEDGSQQVCVQQGCITYPPDAVNCWSSREHPACQGWPTP